MATPIAWPGPEIEVCTWYTASVVIHMLYVVMAIVVFSVVTQSDPESSCWWRCGSTERCCGRD